MPSLEEMIQDVITRGEFSHISLAANGKQWTAAFTPCSTFGVSMVTHADPVEAMKGAIGAAKMKRRAVSKPKEPEPEDARIDAPGPDALDSLAAGGTAGEPWD